MRKTFLTIGVVFLVMFANVTSSSAKNVGRISNPDKIAGNGLDYDFVLMFYVRKGPNVYRAINDIELAARENNDRIVRVGAISKCIMLTIKNNTSINNLFSKYANATRYGNLSRVLSFKQYNSGLGSALVFGEKSIDQVCK